MPFLEPVLRALVLGLGAGFLAELIHVLAVVRALQASLRLLQDNEVFWPGGC